MRRGVAAATIRHRVNRKVYIYRAPIQQGDRDDSRVLYFSANTTAVVDCKEFSTLCAFPFGFIYLFFLII